MLAKDINPGALSQLLTALWGKGEEDSKGENASQLLEWGLGAANGPMGPSGTGCWEKGVGA